MGRLYLPWVPGPRTLPRIGAVHAWIYRATNGAVGKRVDGLEILLLYTWGRRSGVQRVAPLPFFRIDGALVVVGSNSGRDTHPGWVHNITSRPEVEIQLGREILRARARFARGDERTRLYGEVARRDPRFARYPTWTERMIPVVVLAVSSPSQTMTSSGGVDDLGVSTT